MSRRDIANHEVSLNDAERYAKRGVEECGESKSSREHRKNGMEEELKGEYWDAGGLHRFTRARSTQRKFIHSHAHR